MKGLPSCPLLCHVFAGSFGYYTRRHYLLEYELRNCESYPLVLDFDNVLELALTILIPSSCGIEGYRPTTSMVTRYECLLTSCCRKMDRTCPVSFKYVCVS